MKNLSFWGFLSFTGKLRLRMCRKSDQWIFGCFMGLRTGIRGSVDGGKDSAMEALEWPKTITTEQSTFLVQLNLIRSSKISVTRTDAEKSSKSFVITKIWVRPNWSQSEIFSESCLLSNPKLLRRGNRSWLPLFSTSSRLSTRRALQNKDLVREKSVKSILQSLIWIADGLQED